MAYQTPLVLSSGQTQRLQSGDLLTDRRWVDVYQSGFLNQTETSLSFNDSTYVFTLTDAGSGWSYYRLGVLYTISGNKTVTLPGTPPTKGQYFIYIDATDGTLSQSTSPWTLQDGKIPVAIITWDNALTPKYYIQEERHSCLMDRRTHLYLHNTRGTQYITGGELTGYTIGTDTDAANTFAIGQAVIADEDLYLTLAAVTDGNGTDPTNYFVVYRDGASTWDWAYSDMPFSYTTSGYINWDNAGTLTEGTGGTGGAVRYYNTYLIFTNNGGLARFVVIPGQNAHTTTASAYAEVFANFTLTGLPIVEWVAIYQLTWKTGASGLTNKGKCQLTRAPQRITTSAITASATTPVAHNNLSGLQGGTTGEYYHLTSAQNTLVSGATATPTADSLTKADSGGKLAIGWIPTVTTVGDPGSDSYVPTEQAVREALSGVSGGTVYLVANGRLTLTSGTAITTSDVTAATSVYYTPYNGNRLALYNGSAWEIKTLTELTLSLSGATADKNNDIFVYDNSGTLTLEKVEWTNDTTRATALTTQDGVYVKSGATGRRYLGTIRTTATTGQTEDSTSKRYCWNYYNRAPRIMTYTDTTASWTYNSTTWRQARGQSGARVDCVSGISLVFHSVYTCAAYYCAGIGIGYNSTTTPSNVTNESGTSDVPGMTLAISQYGIVGLNTIYPLERARTGGATGNYYGVKDSQNSMFFCVYFEG